MPQEPISIRNFGGMMTNPHKEDIPDNMAVYAYNLDPQSELGVLKGIEVSGAAYQANGNVEIPDVFEADWIKYTRENVSLSVVDATNANPIVVETLEHNLVSGDKVVIASVGGNTAANGTWRITVVDSTHFSIPVAGNGAYTSGGTVTYTGGGKYDLIYVDQDDNEVTAIENFYDDETYRTLTDVITGAGVPKCVKTFNSQAQIGFGTSNAAKAVYRLLANKDFFNNLEIVSAGVQDESGYCYNAATASGGVAVTAGTENAAAEGYFQNGILYSWKASFVYDGLQESNLAGEFSDNPSADSDYYDLTVTVDSADTITNIDSRITAVNIYRAESSDTQSANLGLYRLVDTIDINDGWGANNWSLSGSDYVITFRDSGSYTAGGQTYEENTGMPETLARQSIEYNINEVGGGYHWVTSGQPTGQGSDFTRYLFRSKKFRPNMFDWTRDFLVLDELPTALAWYNDRLYAFSENTTYRINPELLYIEDTYFGAGASHRQSVCVSEYGLYFCNLNGAYRIQDSGIEVISDPIAEVPRTENYIGWKAFALATAGANFDRVVIKAEVDKRLVLFAGATASNASDCLAFYIPTGQWYRLGLGSAAMAADSGYYSGKDGEVYISNATASYRLFAGATYETTSWISKEFHLNEPSQNKSWNMIKWDGTAGTGTISVFYGTEGALPSTAATSGAWINTYKKTFQVSLVTTGNALVDSIDIIVRRLYGKR